MRVRTALQLLTSASILVLALAGSSGAAGARAAGAPHPVVQQQSGVASGSNYFVFLPTRRHFDAGTYASTGQLGRGRYSFTTTFSDDPNALSATGTAKLVRSDGAVLTGAVTFTQSAGPGNPSVTYRVMLSGGTLDLVGANLTFTGVLDNHIVPGPGESGTELLSFSGTSSAAARIGYWMVGSHGAVYPFGGADRYASATTSAAVHIEPTPSRNGYWIVDASGGVFAFGDARWLGNANPAAFDAGESVVSLSATPSGHGYWLFTNRGRELPFGDTNDFGDLHATTLNAPVVGSVATPTGNGYYMVAGDGGVFAFGDARFRGSMGATHLNQPMVGLVPTADNRGYWLVASDGGVFSFNAPFRGSMGNTHLNQPVIGMVRYGTGYLMIASDGGIFDFSSRPFFGSLGGAPPVFRITGAASAG